MTMDEIRNVSFRTGLNGYKTADVDEFVEEVIAVLEQANKEKADLVAKMNLLVARIEEYRNDEETVRNAFLSSQKVADTLIREAKANAVKIIDDAKIEAKRLETVTDEKIFIQKKNLVSLKNEASKFRADLMQTYKNHIKLIDSLPTETTVNNSKTELDEKYPSAIKIQNTGESLFKEVAKTEPEVQKEEEKEAEVIDFKTTEPKAKIDLSFLTQQQEKGEKKFRSLRFGEEYDVTTDKVAK